MMDFVIVLLLIVLLMLFGLNNGALFEGGLVGNGSFKYQTSALIVGGGLLLGALLEGTKTSNFALSLGGYLSGYVAIIIILIQLALFFAFSYIKLPLSITQALIGAWVGALIFLRPGFNASPIYNLVFWWTVSPVIAILVSAILFQFLKRITSKWRLAKISYFNRFLLLIIVFYTSFVLGANNIGFIKGAFGIPIWLLVVISVAATVGAVFMSSGFTKSIGEDFIVLGPLGIISALLGGATVLLMLTLMGYPASLTTTTLGGMIGVGLASRPSRFKTSYLVMITASWVLAGFLGFAISGLVFKLL
ncbi:MAG: inorganic phosphate transporter [Nitrososphaerota archaeon]|jgi:PiT family inorganic phosphate transporter|nr:inorganic phosphate transporter [Nitrososphaerota archaeon]MDG7048027.1 inorganic phosphate transporter [Nitrososphaerota archaeon]